MALVLAFSAFEYFYKAVLGLNVPDMNDLLWDEYPGDMLTFRGGFEFLIQSPETDQLFRKIHPHVNPTHQKSIDDMLAGSIPNLIRIFAALRHAFIHGHLTPGMGGAQPTTVIELCEFAFTFLMDMMDKELSRRIHWSS